MASQANWHQERQQIASPGFSSYFATKSVMGENLPLENFWGFRMAKKLSGVLDL